MPSSVPNSSEALYHRELKDASWDDDFAVLAGSEVDWQGPEVQQALASYRQIFAPLF